MEEQREYGYQGFVHFDYANIDTMSFDIRDDADGDRTQRWQAVTWQQNADWYPSKKQDRTASWDHTRYTMTQKYDNAGIVPKVQGDYYSWYRVEGQLEDPDGDTTSWREVVLVDNHAEGSDRDGKQNPPQYPVADPNDVEIDFKIESYWDIGEALDYGHEGWGNEHGWYPWEGENRGGKHGHAQLGMYVEVMRYSERLENSWKAVDISEKLFNGFNAWASSQGVSEAVLKYVKVTKVAGVASDLLTGLQTGRVVDLSLASYDGWKTIPMTDATIHPKGAFTLAGPAGVAVATGATAVDAVPIMGHRVPYPPGTSNPPQEGEGVRTTWFE